MVFPLRSKPAALIPTPHSRLSAAGPKPLQGAYACCLPRSPYRLPVVCRRPARIPGTGRRRSQSAKPAICHHLLRRRARPRAMAAQPRAGAPGPARASPISCPASSCCLERRAACIARRAEAPESSNVGFAQIEAGGGRRLWRDPARDVRRPRDRQPWLRPFRRQGLEQGGLAERVRLVLDDPARRLFDQRHRGRSRRAGAAFADTDLQAFARPICRPARRSTRRLRRPASPMTPAVFRTGRSCRGESRRRALRPAANSRRTGSAAGHRHGLQSVRASLGRFRTAGRGRGLPGAFATRRSAPRSTRNIRASAFRCSSASTSR